MVFGDTPSVMTTSTGHLGSSNDAGELDDSTAGLSALAAPLPLRVLHSDDKFEVELKHEELQRVYPYSGCSVHSVLAQCLVLSA